MSDEINVLSRTQIIFVEPSTGSVSVINAGPAGPSGTGGGGGNTNPINFLGANTTQAKFETNPAGGNILSQLIFVADNASGGIARAALQARKYGATPQFDGAALGLYNGDGLNGIFAHAFPAEDLLQISAALGQTTPLFIVYDHDAANKLLQITPTGAIDILEQSVPGSPAANIGRLYAFDDSGVTKLAFKDSAGTITVLGAGGGGFPIVYDDGTYTYSITASTGGVLIAETFLDADADWDAQVRSSFVAGVTAAMELVAFASGGNQARVSATAHDATPSHALIETDGHLVQLFVGTSSPNGVLTAGKGSLFFDNVAPALYQNTDGATAWSVVGGGASKWEIVAGNLHPISDPVSFTLTTASGDLLLTGDNNIALATNSGDILLDSFGGGILLSGHGNAIYLTPGNAQLHLDGQEIVDYDSPGFGSYFQITQRTAPGTPAADRVRIYVKDNGDGKSELYLKDETPYEHTLTQETYRAASVSGSVTVDYAKARTHKLTMTGNITTLTLSGATSGLACSLTLYLVQDATGSRLVTWPSSVKWASGAVPTLSTAANAVDLVVMETFDGGTTWYANLAGKAYA